MIFWKKEHIFELICYFITWFQNSYVISKFLLIYSISRNCRKQPLSLTRGHNTIYPMFPHDHTRVQYFEKKKPFDIIVILRDTYNSWAILLPRYNSLWFILSIYLQGLIVQMMTRTSSEFQHGQLTVVIYNY